jgi:hypothetical protein
MQVMDGWVYIHFVFTPTFAFPVITFQDVKVTTLGAGAMPASMRVDDAFWDEEADGEFFIVAGCAHGDG